jgi:Fis family transcriptional regulator, factor for inversion stimulation protein
MDRAAAACCWNSGLCGETALGNSSCSEIPIGVFFRHSEFSADEIEAVRRLVGRPIAAVERELICETLVRRGGNRTHAATVLGISIRALRNKIRVYRMYGRRVSEPHLCVHPASEAAASGI